MEVKKIVEGMTAVEVAQVIDENFNGLNDEKATVEAVADVQKNVDLSDDNTGILSYPVFDDTESVEVGAVRRYEGLLYRAKVAGAYDWDPEKWERVTLKQLEDEKLSELGSKVDNVALDASISVGRLKATAKNGETIVTNDVVKVGDVVSLSLILQYSAGSVRVYNSEGAVIKGFDAEGKNVGDVVTFADYTIPEGFAYMAHNQGYSPSVGIDLIIKNIYNRAMAESLEGLREDIEENEGKFSNIDEFIKDVSDIVENEVENTIKVEETSGSYIMASGEKKSGSFYYTNKIAVKEGDVLRMKYLDNGELKPFGIRFVCAYNNNSVVRSSGSDNQVSEYIVPQGITHVVLSYSNAETYATHYVYLVAKEESYKLSVESIPSAISTSIYGGNILTSESEKLDSNGISLGSNNVSCMSLQTFSCELEDSNIDIYIGHGLTNNQGSYIRITNEKVMVYYSSTTLANEYTHGLQLSKYLKVVIDGNYINRANITIQSIGGMYEIKDAVWFGRNGSIFAKSTNQQGFTKMTWTCKLFDKPIYAYGDSYFDAGSTMRWTYYMVNNGYTNILYDNFGGRKSSEALLSLKETLKMGTPKYVLWCLGMNDADTDTSINQSWKDCVDEVIGICNDKKIELVLATIPNVPNRNHNYKNEYVKSLGVRYIDFSAAVVENGSVWFDGMLSSDDVHPDVLGAKALYMQVLTDFPEACR